ncbi:hypothetical protein RHGRI_000667 [Rhododendron griersonianum]|uniref:Protein kinase domain-containing protein n=1 Tax=Rhododendron griersonianum TaxID=479676 RepID=A0AAV6LHX1_9ERIC|nr:hypothetical protein RHGRI_000667 [Rhododendron griersonianum]
MAMKLWMKDKKAEAIAVSLIIALTISIIVARISLGLSKTFYFITGAIGAAILAVIAIYLLRNRYNSRRRLLETQMASESKELRIEYSFLRKVAGVPTKFRHREIEVATDGFRCLVGKGSSGSVFKGILTDGSPVAVKRIEGEERGEKEFRSEVAAIASVQHVNLVRLLGYCCVPTGPRFLVYDFAPNGSLDKWIFPRKEKEEISLREKIQHTGRGGVDEREVKRLVCVGLWCMQEDARMRPSMAEVVEMLERREEVEEPPESPMFVVDVLSINEEVVNPGRGRRGIATLPATQEDCNDVSSASWSTLISVLSGR